MTYVPAFECLTCKEQGNRVTWSARFHSYRIYNDQPRSQRERIEQAHQQYRPGHRVAKVKR